MRRRLSLVQQPTYQAITDYRQACVDALLDAVTDRMTFLEIADLLGVSHEYVRKRLTQHPDRLLWIGKGYRVPYDVAVEFIKSVVSTPVRRLQAKENRRGA